MAVLQCCGSAGTPFVEHTTVSLPQLVCFTITTRRRCAKHLPNRLARPIDEEFMKMEAFLGMPAMSLNWKVNIAVMMSKSVR